MADEPTTTATRRHDSMLMQPEDIVALTAEEASADLHAAVDTLKAMDGQRGGRTGEHRGGSRARP